MDSTEAKREKVGSILDIKHYLYETYYADVYRTIYYIVSDKDILQDLVNESFIRAFEKLHTLRETDKFKPWICVIAANIAKSYMKKQQKLVSMENLESIINKNDYSDDIVFDKIEEIELINRLKLAIDQLDNDSKEIVILRYFHDLSYEDVSKSLNIKEGTVKSKLNRAKHKLYKLIKMEGECGDR